MQVAFNFRQLFLFCILQKYFFLTKDWWEPSVRHHARDLRQGSSLLHSGSCSQSLLGPLSCFSSVVQGVRCLSASKPSIVKCYPQYLKRLPSNIPVFVYSGKWSSKFSPECSSESQPRITHAPENACSPLTSTSSSFLPLFEVLEFGTSLCCQICVLISVWLQEWK